MQPSARSPLARLDAAVGLVIGMLAAVPAGSTGPAAEVPWLSPGSRVLLRSAGVSLQVETRTITLGGIHHVYRAERVQGEWVWISEGRLAGWPRRSSLLPLDQAVDYYSDAVRRHPDAAWAYLGRGLVWHARREFELALANFDEAIRADPALAAAFNNRALVRAALGDPGTALADLDTAVRLDSHSRGAEAMARGESIEATRH